MRYAAIADIAGENDALENILGLIPDTHEKILLGDIFDRGPDSDKVASWAIKNNIKWCMGNHEHMVIDFYRNKNLYSQGIWYEINGGDSTYDSYKDKPDILEEHLKHIEKLPHFYDLPIEVDGFNTVRFSHAPLKPMYEDEEENIESFLWSRQHPIRRNYFQINGHNADWGVLPYKDDKGLFGYSIDDSHNDKLTCILLPEMEVIQVDI